MKTLSVPNPWPRVPTGRWRLRFGPARIPPRRPRLGRPVLIVRLGARMLSAEEMAQQAIPGTVLLPGQEGLGLPPVPPCIPWAGIPVYDPILGPRPAEEECMHDGGDVGTPAGLDAQGRLRGLDPSDTVAVYTDNHGQKHLAISNRVCICVPRFGIVTVPLAPAGYESYLALGRAETVLEQAVLRTKLPPVEVRQHEQLVAVSSRERASAGWRRPAPCPWPKFKAVRW